MIALVACRRQALVHMIQRVETGALEVCCGLTAVGTKFRTFQSHKKVEQMNTQSREWCAATKRPKFTCLDKDDDAGEV